MRTLRGHTHAVRAVAYAPGRPGLLASAGDDRTVRLWDAPSGELLVTHPGHGDSLLSLAFDPSGAVLASGGRTGSLAWWTAEGGGLSAVSNSLVSRGAAVALAVTAGGGAVLAALRSLVYGDSPGVWRWGLRPPERTARIAA